MLSSSLAAKKAATQFAEDNSKLQSGTKPIEQNQVSTSDDNNDNEVHI